MHPGRVDRRSPFGRRTYGAPRGKSLFFGILASVLAAVGANSRLRSRDPRLLYAGLAGSLLLACLLPPSSQLIDPPVLRNAVGSAIAFAPVFFANLAFTFSFRHSDVADLAFSANLVGGVLEWSALVTGYQALLVLVAAVYLVGACRMRRRPRHERSSVRARVWRGGEAKSTVVSSSQSMRFFLA